MPAKNSCYCTSSSGGRLGTAAGVLAVSILLLLTATDSEGIILSGTPPSFPDPNYQPQNQFVFERDGNDMPVTLTFHCPVAGDPLPDVTWYRGGVVDNVNRAANGSYVYPNITAADSAFADGDGVKYYCTATNVFGTIRSRTVRAFYADFKGFEDGPEQEDDEFPDPTMVDVIVTAGDAQRWVALNCTLNPDSTPPPEIEWVQRNTGGGGETVLDEDTSQNRVRFIDDKQWLILETTSDAVNGKEYFCRVTNKERFQIVRGPLLYELNAVDEFDVSEYPEGVRIYKPLTNKTAPRVAVATEEQRVVFGTGVAFGGGRTFRAWSVNGRDDRVIGRGAVGEVDPVSVEMDDSLIIKVELVITPEMSSQLEPLVAYLHLLDPASITDPTPESVPDSLTEKSHMFTCSVAGSPLPTVTFYHNGLQLENGGAITISGGTLTISPTAENHSGMYQCLVENESGADIATWSLQVRAPKPPTISSSFAVSPDPCLGYPIIQKDAVPFTLSVTLTADPCPTASWTFNGDAITSGISDPCTDDLSITEFTFTLTVNTFTPDTIGNYAVTFNNEGGDASVTDNFVTNFVRADIDDVIGIRPDPYHPVGDGSGELCLVAGSPEVKIVCPNTAFPVAEVSFFKNRNPVVLGGRVTKSCDTLTISPVEESDRGSYSCEVENDGTPQAEDRSENTIELEYCIAPTIVADLVFTKNKPDEGDETSAVCEWAGSPTPEVTWFKDGEPLDEETLPSRIRIVPTDDFHSELQIREVELDDTGDYVCNVSNPVGSAFQRKRLEVQEVDKLPLSTVAIIGIAAGGGAAIVLLAVVVVLLCCVYQCARRSSTGEYVVPGSKNNVPMVTMGGPELNYNVDAPDGPDEEPEAFNPDYASLPALRPERPPQYKPTPHYPAEFPQGEFQKMAPSDEDFVGPYGNDNGMQPGGMPPHSGYPQQPTVDDFVSDDAQFV